MKKLCVILTLLFGFSVLSGCVAGHYRGPGVNARIVIPLAPVNGYRHHIRNGVTLIFDAGLGVYIVAGHPGYYYYNGRYFRRHADGHWIYGHHFRGPWVNYVSDGRLPRGFRNKMHRVKRHIREERREHRHDARHDRRNRKDLKKDLREDRRDYRNDVRKARKDFRDDVRDDVRDYRKDARDGEVDRKAYKQDLRKDRRKYRHDVRKARKDFRRDVRDDLKKKHRDK